MMTIISLAEVKKAGLLRKAKNAIASGESAYREAATALALTRDRDGTSQQEMAKAVGKSRPWISCLLRWCDSDFKDKGPFDASHASRASKKRHKSELEPEPEPEPEEFEFEESEPDPPQTVWRRGLIYRAQEAKCMAGYEKDWSQFQVDREMLTTVNKAATAWADLATFLEELYHGKK
jgi:hypothetical protein